MVVWAGRQTKPIKVKVIRDVAIRIREIEVMEADNKCKVTSTTS